MIVRLLFRFTGLPEADLSSILQADAARNDYFVAGSDAAEHLHTIAITHSELDFVLMSD